MNCLVSDRPRKAFTILAPVMILLLLLPTSLFAQSIVTGAVNGTVTDPSGAVVPGATVTLKDQATGESKAGATNSAGLFSFALLRPGTYTLAVSQTGFKSAAQNIEVTLGQTALANFKLSLGNTSETVEVTAAGQAIQLEDANISTNIGQRTINNIPNPGNDITYFAQTAPGVSMNTSSGNGYGNFSAFGLPGTANLFTMNGNDYNDPFLNLNNSGASNLLLGGNEVQEVAVVNNAYTGQYGRQAGAQVDYSTKSGTNAFHGDASYSWTGKAMDANDWFNNFNNAPRPFQNNNQWADAIGGPIIKNKLFFFVNNEGLRYIFGTSTTVYTPAPLFEQEVLGNIPSTSVPFYNNMFSLYNNAPGINRATLADNSCGSYTPINPAIGAQCLQTWRDTTTNGNTEWLMSARVDWNIGDKDKLFGRYKHDQGTQPTYTDPINSIFNTVSKQPQNEGQLNYTHTFNPNLVNNFIGSVLYYSAIFGSADLNGALAKFPYILASAGDTSLTALGSGGSDYLAGFLFPQGRNVTQWGLVDDVSWTKGKHSLKFGGNFRRDDVSDHTAGEQPFPADVTDLNGFATGIVDTFVAQNFARSASQPIAISSWGVYGQDQWKYSSKLTFTLTLRVDRNSPGTCQNGCASKTTQPFNWSTFDHSATVPYDQMVYSSKQILRNIQLAVVEPRFGFAWDPYGDGKTALRGGVGLFSDLYPGTLLDGFTTNFPEVNRFSIAGSFPLSPTEAGNAASIVSGCNAGFTSNFKSGGTVTSYEANNPLCAGNVPNLNDVAQHSKNPTYLQWNFELQQALSNSTTLSVNYVGNHGYDILTNSQYLNAFGFGTLPATAPDSRVLQTNGLYNGGISNYNGITVSINQRVWHGLTGSVNYSWSHASDEISNGGVLPYSIYTSITNQVNPYCLRCQYASADYDARQNLNANYVYSLPFKSTNGIVNQFIGGWTVSGTFFFRTGLPFSAIDGATAAGLVGNNFSSSTPLLAYPSGNGVLPQNCGAPTVSAGQIVPCIAGPGNALGLTPVVASATGFNGIPRNYFRGPGYFNTDLTIRKNFKLTERFNFQAAANFYNVLNHPNFASPYPNLAVPSIFGSAFTTISPPTTPYGAFASAAEDARIVQLNFKLIF